MNRIILILVLIMTTLFARAEEISLDGDWQFTTDPAIAYDINNISENASWRKANTPSSWQAQFNDLRDYLGVAWYRKTIRLSELKDSQSAHIHFNAVDYMMWLYINGQLAGEHEGGYTPFEFDISKWVQSGENEIMVRVLDPDTTEDGTEGISAWHIPHGKQSWYVQNSGIWQSAAVHIRQKDHIRHAMITANINGNVKVEIELARDQLKIDERNLQVSIFDPQGKEVFGTDKTLKAEQTIETSELCIQNPILWDLDDPALYKMVLRLDNGEEWSGSFGFRSFESRDGRFYLNDQPIYIMAALDQDFYPETIYTTPSEEYLRDEMLKAKKLGLNMLRCHIKVPDPLYLKVADEVGLLVWTEVPNWDVFTTEAARRGMQTMDNMLHRDWNHPSLVIVSIINESWGIDLQKAAQRRWLLDEFDRVKKLAIGRLVVDNSACWGNFHLKTDINDYHTYWAIPENRERFTRTIVDVTSRPDWLWSGFGDAKQTGTEPLMISEFGNWGLPILEGEQPWWFESDFLRREVTLPDGYQQRFVEFGYEKIFGNYTNLAVESQLSQFRALKWEIEEIRRHEDIAGYVITEFTDLNWECNGLLDMWRNEKKYAKELPLVQQADVIIPRPERYVYWDGEEVAIDLWLSHYSSFDLKNIKLLWHTTDGQNGKLKIAEIARSKSVQIGKISFNAIAGETANKVRIELKIYSDDGRILSANYLEVFIYPSLIREKHIDAAISDKSILQSDIGEVNTKNSVFVTNHLDETIQHKLRSGRPVICLVDSSTILPKNFPVNVKSREEEWLDGNWASNLNWVHAERTPFRDIVFANSLGFEIAECVPNRVVTDIPSENFDDVLAGMFVGWLQLNSGYVVQMKAGESNLILCTFPLTDSPFAKTLLNAMSKYIDSGQCNPSITWDF